jgi:hypothetical protein
MATDERNLKYHAYALDVSGYTILPGQVGPAELELLRGCADRALSRTAELTAQGTKLRHTFTHAYYNSCRCMYCWGDACVRLLEHDAIHGLAGAVMDNFQLWDMLVMATLPAPEGAEATTAWHRDFTGMVWGAPTPGYLWFNLCLDDVTPENGATWVVPGSHRRAAGRAAEPAISEDRREVLEMYPTRLQVCAKAGDIVVFSPTLLHNSGHNRSKKARRLLNVGLCHRSLPPLLNHWAIAGPAIREGASERLRSILNAEAKPLEETWTGLPTGWPDAAR